MNKHLSEIASYIKEKYHCHTIIVYGSHARGEANTTSDYDMIGIRDEGEFERDCKTFDGVYLDAFIYSNSHIAEPDASLIRIKDGIVLSQKDSIGDNLLNKVRILYDKGPAKTPAWEIIEIKAWLQKMLSRSTINDIEGNFRRHWVLHDILECYFKLRHQWYLGPKESFKWLSNNDSLTYHAFEKALAPDADLTLIEKLMNRVIGIG